MSGERRGRERERETERESERERERERERDRERERGNVKKSICQPRKRNISLQSSCLRLTSPLSKVSFSPNYEKSSKEEFFVFENHL
jgi:hypothetical protein